MESARSSSGSPSSCSEYSLPVLYGEHAFSTIATVPVEKKCRRRRKAGAGKVAGEDSMTRAGALMAASSTLSGAACSVLLKASPQFNAFHVLFYGSVITMFAAVLLRILDRTPRDIGHAVVANLPMVVLFAVTGGVQEYCLFEALNFINPAEGEAVFRFSLLFFSFCIDLWVVGATTVLKVLSVGCGMLSIVCVMCPVVVDGGGLATVSHLLVVGFLYRLAAGLFGALHGFLACRMCSRVPPDVMVLATTIVLWTGSLAFILYANFKHGTPAWPCGGGVDAGAGGALLVRSLYTAGMLFNTVQYGGRVLALQRESNITVEILRSPIAGVTYVLQLLLLDAQFSLLSVLGISLSVASCFMCAYSMRRTRSRAHGSTINI